MKVEIKGKDLVITIPATFKNPPPSKSGKTLTVASTGGFKESELEVGGKLVYVNLNAYVHAKSKNDE